MIELLQFTRLMDQAEYAKLPHSHSLIRVWNEANGTMQRINNKDGTNFEIPTKLPYKAHPSGKIEVAESYIELIQKHDRWKKTLTAHQ